VQSRVEAIVQELGWSHPVFAISALAKQGTVELCRETMKLLEGQEG